MTRRQAAIGATLILSLLLAATGRGAAFLSAAWSNAGNLYFNQARAAAGPADGALNAASIALSDAAALDPQDSATWRALGLVYATAGNQDAAISAWRNAGGMTDELRAWGTVSLWGGDYAASAVWFQRALALEPDNGEAWAGLGRAQAQQGKTEEALLALQQAVVAEPPPHALSDLYLQIGRLQMLDPDGLNREAALAAFDAAIAADDFSLGTRKVDAYYQRGATQWQLGEGAAALADFRWVLDRGEHYGALVGAGVLTWQLEGDEATALALLKSAVALDPDAKWAYRGLGQVYEGTGNDAQAIAAFRQVLVRDPEDTLARERLEALAATQP